MTSADTNGQRHIMKRFIRLTGRRGRAYNDQGPKSMGTQLRTVYKNKAALNLLTLALTTIVPLPLSAQQKSIEGFSQPRRIAQLSAGANGVLSEKVVSEGERVDRGQLIAKLESSVHEALIEIAKAGMQSAGQLQAAMADVKLRQQRLRLVEQLGQQEHASNEELFRAKTEAEFAQANLQTAKEKLLHRQLEYKKLVAQLKTYAVRAPFNGYIVELKKELGEYVGPAAPVVCIFAELEVLSVNFLVPRSQLGELRKGLQAEVLFLQSKREVVGTVHSVSPYPNGETNTYTVKVHVQNSDGGLLAGERCRLKSSSKKQSVQN